MERFLLKLNNDESSLKYTPDFVSMKGKYIWDMRLNVTPTINFNNRFNFWKAFLDKDISGLQERRGDNFPLIIDLDLTEKLSDEDIEAFCKEINFIITQIFKTDGYDIYCIVQYRDNPKDKADRLSYGVHIIWPNVIVNSTMALLVREYAKQEIKMFDDFDKVYDKAIYTKRNLYWKMEGTDGYKIQFIVSDNAHQTLAGITEELDNPDSYFGNYFKTRRHEIGYYIPLMTVMGRSNFISPMVQKYESQKNSEKYEILKCPETGKLKPYYKTSDGFLLDINKFNSVVRRQKELYKK